MKKRGSFFCGIFLVLILFFIIAAVANIGLASAKYKGKTDLGIYWPYGGNWSVLKSSTNYIGSETFNFGWPGARPVSLLTWQPLVGDYDGDGITDVAVYCNKDCKINADDPDEGVWFIGRSTQGYLTFNFGFAEAFPAVGDYNGDGITDIAVFTYNRSGNSNEGLWYFYLSANSGLDTGYFYDADLNLPGMQPLKYGYWPAKPVPADYDGDGKTDLGIYDPNGIWYTYNVFASNNPVSQNISFGYKGLVPVVADYDGDGKDDIALYDSAIGKWYILQSTETYKEVNWGFSDTYGVPGYYDDDMKADFGVYDDDTGGWYIRGSGGGTSSFTWGFQNTIPVPGNYDGDYCTWGSNLGWNGSTCVTIEMGTCSTNRLDMSNTLWNDNGKNGMFQQYRNVRGGLSPVSIDATYNRIPGNCTYVCNYSFKYNSANKKCVYESCLQKNVSCFAVGTLPSNAVWNDNGKNGNFTQTGCWNDFNNDYDFNFPIGAGYSETPGTCKFKCTDSTYIWNNEEFKCEKKLNQTQCGELNESQCKSSVFQIKQIGEATVNKALNLQKATNNIDYCDSSSSYISTSTSVNTCKNYAVNCICKWEASTGCKSNYETQTRCTSPPTGSNPGECVLSTPVIQDNCNTTGKIIYTQKETWMRGELDDDPTCKDIVKELACPINATLGFFDLFNLISCFVLVSVVYFILLRKSEIR